MTDILGLREFKLNHQVFRRQAVSEPEHISPGTPFINIIPYVQCQYTSAVEYPNKRITSADVLIEIVPRHVDGHEH